VLTAGPIRDNLQVHPALARMGEQPPSSGADLAPGLDDFGQSAFGVEEPASVLPEIVQRGSGWQRLLAAEWTVIIVRTTQIEGRSGGEDRSG
jgi:hypothetical protein